MLDRVYMMDSKRIKPRRFSVHGNLKSTGKVSSPVNMPIQAISAFSVDQELGHWPRRLYHIASKTSCTWQPGNIYGKHVEPKYNALSYTWGRWELEADEKPWVKSIQIHGVPWVIPRIDPDDHFTAAQFETIIQHVANPYPSRSKSKSSGRELRGEKTDTVSFVWIDVACIDQRDNSDRASEIGRQGMIFSGALRVYAWLSHLTEEGLQEIVSTLEDASQIALDETPFFVVDTHAENMYNEYHREALAKAKMEADVLGTGLDVMCGTAPEYYGLSEQTWMTNAVWALRALREDPWLSSLWTLQEAFIRTDATLLSQEACSVDVNLETDTEPNEEADLNAILSFCETLKMYCERLNVFDQAQANYAVDLRQEMLELCATSGFDVLRAANPMALYTAARHRTAKYELDHIYGIMQVFGFRLGKSNPDSERAHELTLMNLEDELGEALMHQSPILSQAHVLTSANRDVGKGWRISRTSQVPGHGYSRSLEWQDIVKGMSETSCKMSTENVDSVRWGWFSGKVCRFETLQKIWASIGESYLSIDEKISQLSPNWIDLGCAMHIALDFNPTVFLHLLDLSDYRIPSGLGQYKLAKWMVENLNRDQLRVLHLGLFNDSVHKYKQFGLLLLQSKSDQLTYWRRLGICRWDSYYQEPWVRSSETAREEGWQPVNEAGADALLSEGAVWNFSSILEGSEHLTADSSAWEDLSGLFG